MKDRLKEFVELHRADFDDALPKDLWPGIAADLAKKPDVQLKKIKNMLKYGFGASALIAGTFVILQSQKQHIHSGKTLAQRQYQQTTKQVELPNPEKESVFAVNTRQKTNEQKEAASAMLPEDTGHFEEKIPTAGTATPPAESQKTGLGDYHMVVSSGVFMNKGDDKDSTMGRYFAAVDTIFKAVSKLEVVSEYCRINIKAGVSNDVMMSGKVGGAAGNVVCLGMRCYMSKINICRYEKRDSVLRVWIETKSLKERVKITKNDKEQSVLSFVVPKWLKVEVRNESGDIALDGVESSPLSLRTSYGNVVVSGTTGELILNSGSGNLVVKSHNGNVRAVSSYGNQSLEDITGDLFLHSGSGHIKLKNLKGNLEAVSSYGDQNLQHVSGRIQSIVSSGQFTASEITGNIQVKSSYGKLTFNNVAGDISAQASSGSIMLNGFKGVLGLGTSYGNISGKDVMLLGNSEFKTSSGNIGIELLNVMSDLNFDLSASSGRMTVEKEGVKKTAENNLLIGSGKVTIKGVSSYGNQSYR